MFYGLDFYFAAQLATYAQQATITPRKPEVNRYALSRQIDAWLLRLPHGGDPQSRKTNSLVLNNTRQNARSPWSAKMPCMSLRSAGTVPQM